MDNQDVPARRDATSDATRLLCAGTYLDPVYRKSVIRELLANQFRVVAPAYGYDAVSVLAHALAAHNLRRRQLYALAGGTVLIVLLGAVGLLSALPALLAFVWLVWATAYLRRIATLHALVHRLRPGRDGQGFDGGYPTTSRLTPQLVQKIAHEQASGDGLVLFGGYTPFVGAGARVRRWSNSELLVGAPLNPFDKSILRPVPGRTVPVPRDEIVAESDAGERKAVVPFTVDEITGYVCEQMRTQLHDAAPQGEQIRGLTVERRKYRTAIRKLDGALGGAPSNTPVLQGEERSDAARDFLCVRIGSWNQELVTSIFVGFDLKGNTLHTEFYTYVLTPIIESFHLVDRLPVALDGRLMRRVAWDVAKSLPGDAVRLVTNPLRERLPRALRRTSGKQPAATVTIRVPVLSVVDTSEFRLGRYATHAADFGALTSVRQMAMSEDFHYFFQETDAVKYMQIVERRLLQIVGTFLSEHNVDLHDHNANQTNILQQNIGDKANFGTGNVSYDTHGPQTLGNNSPIDNPEAQSR